MAVTLDWFNNGAPVDEETGLLGASNIKTTFQTKRTGTIAKRDSHLKEFLQKMDAITKELRTVKTKFQELKDTYDDSLGAGTAESMRIYKADLEAHMQEIKTSTQVLSNKITSLEQDINVEDTDSGTVLQKKVKAGALEAELRTFTQEFFRFQTKMRDDRRAECRRKLKTHLNKDPTDEEVDKWVDGDDSAIYSLLLHDQSRRAVQKVLGDIQERYRAAKQLQKDVQEVTDLFYNLQTLVQQQGQTIDSLANILNQAGHYVGSTHQDVKKAIQYKTNTIRSKTVWYVAIAVAIAVIVAVILGTVLGTRPVQ